MTKMQHPVEPAKMAEDLATLAKGIHSIKDVLSMLGGDGKKVSMTSIMQLFQSGKLHQAGEKTRPRGARPD